MPNTGYLDPVSAYSVSAGLGVVRPWEPGLGAPGTLLSGVNVSDNVKVHVSDVSTNATQFPLFAQFSAAIPAGAEVQGFVVRYERRINAAATAAGGSERWLRLVSGAGAGVEYLSTTANATDPGSWTTTDTYVTAGASADMWGMTTANASTGRVNGPRFGVAILANYAGGTVTSAAMSIDHIQLQIHYTPPTINVDTFSGEWDREAQSTGIVPNAAAQSSEYGIESGSLPLVLNLFPITSEYGYELRPVDITPIEAHSSEYGPETGTASFSKNLIIGTAETGYESSQVDIAQQSAAVAEVFSAETDYEASQVSLSLNAGVQSSEYEVETGLASLTLNAGVESAEVDYESQNAALSVNLSTQGQEQEFEVSSVSLSQVHALGVQDAEQDFEVESAGIGLALSPASSEFDGEVESVSLTLNLTVSTSETDYESTSVLIAQSGIAVDEIDLGYELDGPFLQKNLVIDDSEYDPEIGSVHAATEFKVTPAEFDFEDEGPVLSLNSRSQNYEQGWEAENAALSVIYNVGVWHAEFDREWAYPLPASSGRRRYWWRSLEGNAGRRELRARKLNTSLHQRR